MEDQNEKKDKKKRAFALLLVLLLLFATVGSIIIYRNGKDVAVAETIIEDAEIPMAGALESGDITDDVNEPDGDTVITDGQVPLAAGTVTAPATSLTAAPAADTAELAAGLTELTTVLDTMLAAPAVTEGTISTPSTGTEPTIADSTADNAAAEEAARRAAEAAAAEAQRKIEAAAEVQAKIDTLKKDLETAKINTADAQKALLAAQAQYNTEIAAANEALAKAQDKALAFYNMKFSGITELKDELSQDGKNGTAESKIHEYFTKFQSNSTKETSLDSTGINWAAPINEKGTLVGKSSAVKADNVNNDGGLKKQVESEVKDTSTTQADDTISYSLGDAADAGNGFGYKIDQRKDANKKLVQDIIWTETDYSQLAANTLVPVYYYNAETGALVLTTAKVTSNNGSDAANRINKLELVNSDPAASGNIWLNQDPADPTKSLSFTDTMASVTKTEYSDDMSTYNQAEIEAALKAQQNAESALKTAKDAESAAIAAEQPIVNELNQEMQNLADVGLEPNDTFEEVSQANGFGSTGAETTESIPDSQPAGTEESTVE